MGVSAPFPLEGRRAGDGGASGAADATALEAQPKTRATVKLARRLRRESTFAERLLWTELRKMRMNFRRQVPIGPYVADFAHHTSRLIIEIDGYYHAMPEQQIKDAERTAWLERQGYRVIRFADSLVKNRIDAVLQQILSATTPPSPTLPPSRGKGVS